MPNPSSPLVTHSPELSTLFEYEYSAQESNFIGPSLLPVKTVKEVGGGFGVVPLEELAKHDQTGERAPNSGYMRDDFEFEDRTYLSREYGFEELIGEREEAMYMNYVDSRAFATARLANKLLTASERRIEAKVMAVAQYGTRTDTPSTKWDATGSTPIDDVEDGVREFRDAFGFMPDTLTLNLYTFRDLRLNEQVRDRISAVGAGDPQKATDVTIAMLQAVFDIEKILVGGSMRNAANPNASANMTDIWPDSVLITKTADTGDMREACIGRQFHWTRDNSEIRGHLETYHEPQTRTDVVRTRHDVDENILYDGLGFLLTDVLADH